MNLIWRTIWVLLTSRFGSKVNLFDVSSITFRVLPTDVDFLWHMNNGRYFSLMDLARFNFTIRNNALPLLRKNKIFAVAASEMIRFKKSLNLFQKFQITTQLLGWDHRFFYIAHCFKSKGNLYALALVKGCFVNKSNGTLDPHKVLTLLGHQEISPPLPEWVKQWQTADHSFHQEIISSDKHEVRNVSST